MGYPFQTQSARQNLASVIGGKPNPVPRLIAVVVSLVILLLHVFPLTPLFASPFPVEGEIFDGQGQKVGTAHVYPRYVEIVNGQNEVIGKVGILVENGIARLFLVRSGETMTLVGYASGGVIFGDKDDVRGSYVWTPTWSFVYNKDGKRAGKVKCIAWPRVCAVGVGGYLLNLFEGNSNENGSR